MALELDAVKAYLEVEDTESDDVITSLMASAKKLIVQQTGKSKTVLNGVETDIEDDALFQQCEKCLVAHWYENRGIQVPGTLTNVSISVDEMIKHIAVCGEYL